MTEILENVKDFARQRRRRRLTGLRQYLAVFLENSRAKNKLSVCSLWFSYKVLGVHSTRYLIYMYNKIWNIYHLALLFDKRFLCVTNEKSLAKKCIYVWPAYQLTAEELFILLSAWVVLDFVFLPREHVTISRSVLRFRCRFRLYKFMIIALYTTIKDKSSAWSKFVLQSLKRFMAHWAYWDREIWANTVWVPRDRTEITKMYLNVWKMKFSLLNLQFRMTRVVVQWQLVKPAVCFSDL